MEFFRVLEVRVQAVLGRFDEDGNLVGKQYLPMEEVQHPIGLKVQQMIEKIERQHLPRPSPEEADNAPAR